MQACGRREDAEFFPAHLDSPELNLADVAWVEGQPLALWVHCHGRSRGDRELAYHQERAPVLRAEFADGSSRLVAAAIPDGRVRRRMTVVIP